MVLLYGQYFPYILKKIQCPGKYVDNIKFLKFINFNVTRCIIYIKHGPFELSNWS